MKSTLLWALVVLNLVLLCTFIGRMSHDNTADADRQSSHGRLPGASPAK